MQQLEQRRRQRQDRSGGSSSNDNGNDAGHAGAANTSGGSGGSRASSGSGGSSNTGSGGMQASGSGGSGSGTGGSNSAGSGGMTAMDAGDVMDASNAMTDAAMPSYDDAQKWIDDYAKAHPGASGDINTLTPAQIAAGPDAKRLLSLCGEEQRPVIPKLAWEHRGGDHAWTNPDMSALVLRVHPGRAVD